MILPDRDPAEIVKNLIQEGCTVEDYQKVQDRRKERLAIWETRHKVQPLIENEKKLIALGEKVLTLLKEAYAK